MSLRWEWKNAETGEIVEHDHWSVPPTRPGAWYRVFSLAFARVDGAGSSPGGRVVAK